MTISEMTGQPEWLPGFLEFYNRPERPSIWTALRHYHNKFGDQTALPDCDEVVAVVEALEAAMPEMFQIRSTGPEPELQYLPYELLEGVREELRTAMDLSTQLHQVSQVLSRLDFVGLASVNVICGSKQEALDFIKVLRDVQSRGSNLNIEQKLKKTDLLFQVENFVFQLIKARVDVIQINHFGSCVVLGIAPVQHEAHDA